jgi:hypothetical protein
LKNNKKRKDRFHVDFILFLGIILAFTKRSPIEIAEAIKNFNIESISIELIQHLIQYVPNDSEVNIDTDETRQWFDLSKIMIKKNVSIDLCFVLSDT